MTRCLSFYSVSLLVDALEACKFISARAHTYRWFPMKRSSRSGSFEHVYNAQQMRQIQVDKIGDQHVHRQSDKMVCLFGCIVQLFLVEIFIYHCFFYKINVHYDGLEVIL